MSRHHLPARIRAWGGSGTIMSLTAAPATMPTRWLAPAVTLAVTVTLTVTLTLVVAVGTVGIGLGMLPAAALPPAPASGSAVPQLGRDTVRAALHLDEIPADYVVLVDTSASMAAGGLFGQVCGFLRSYVADLAPSDRFVLISFDVAPSVLYSGPAAGAGSAVSRLPNTPTGERTDIGAAIKEAVNELARHNASPVAAVFLLTDGRHEPPPNSDFPAGDDNPWQALGNNARQQLDVTKVHGYGVALRDSDQARDGAGQLKRALPTTTVLALPPDQLPAYLDHVKDDTRKHKAADVLAADVLDQITVSWEPQLTDVDPAASRLVTHVTLTSQTQRLPIELTDVSIASSDPEVRVDGTPPRITLPPGQSVTIPVTLTWRQHATGLVRRSETVTSELRLGATIDSPWQAVTDHDFGLPLRLHLAGESTSLRGSNHAGWSLPGLLLLTVLAAAVAGVAALGWVWRHPTLTGVLSAEWANGRTVQVQLSGRKMRISPQHRLSVPGTGSVRGRRAKDIGEPRRTDILVRYQPRRVGKLPQARFSPGQSRVVGDVTRAARRSPGVAIGYS
ncbi:vWA domain-containing protein, partial [Protofrankia symbiont of Coriaria ruscifolia]|uniref:vWA domain-containing protein n=1 Tax=Protofrankia symbiont of Coriaria ruscifolia TaxID=1306542 RepID=UPI001041650A